MMYLIVHDKLPITERLFRIGLAADPYCPACLDTMGAIQADLSHFFCECSKVVEVWNEFRAILESLQPSLIVVSNDDIIRLKFNNSSLDTEITWLLGTYLNEVWKHIHVKKSLMIKKERFFGWLKFKFKHDQMGSRPHLNISWFQSAIN